MCQSCSTSALSKTRDIRELSLSDRAKLRRIPTQKLTRAQLELFRDEEETIEECRQRLKLHDAASASAELVEIWGIIDQLEAAVERLDEFSTSHGGGCRCSLCKFLRFKGRDWCHDAAEAMVWNIFSGVAAMEGVLLPRPKEVEKVLELAEKMG